MQGILKNQKCVAVAVIAEVTMQGHAMAEGMETVTRMIENQVLSCSMSWTFRKRTLLLLNEEWCYTIYVMTKTLIDMMR